MAKNGNLTATAKAKKDEFYKQLNDIYAELWHEEYQQFFKDKVIAMTRMKVSSSNTLQ